MNILQISIPRKGFEEYFHHNPLVGDFSTESSAEALTTATEALMAKAAENRLSVDVSTIVIQQIAEDVDGVHTLFGWLVRCWANEVKVDSDTLPD